MRRIIAALKASKQLPNQALFKSTDVLKSPAVMSLAATQDTASIRSIYLRRTLHKEEAFALICALPCFAA
ncbi:MAG: hypothetical protein JWM78_1898 [Verrucomicrobiaceae bacterium]|nr:hypothetical protein [Verrucomicrobiaceae bacterium]